MNFFNNIIDYKSIKSKINFHIINEQIIYYHK